MGEREPAGGLTTLARMADQNFVATRRDGNRIYYRLIDPCVGGVMELGLCLLGHHPIC